MAEKKAVVMSEMIPMFWTITKHKLNGSNFYAWQTNIRHFSLIPNKWFCHLSLIVLWLDRQVSISNTSTGNSSTLKANSGILFITIVISQDIKSDCKKLLRKGKRFQPAHVVFTLDNLEKSTSFVTGSGTVTLTNSIFIDL